MRKKDDPDMNKFRSKCKQYYTSSRNKSKHKIGNKIGMKSVADPDTYERLRNMKYKQPGSVAMFFHDVFIGQRGRDAPPQLLPWIHNWTFQPILPKNKLLIY